MSLKAEIPALEAWEERVSGALKKLSCAIAEHRFALEAERLLIDPQDLAAKHILSIGTLYLPDSALMAKAAGAAGFTARGKGPSEIDDHRALLEMAYRVRNGEKLKPASREAAKLAQGGLSKSANTRRNVAFRLYRKFRKHKELYTLTVEDALDSGTTLDSVAAGLSAWPKLPRWRDYQQASSRPRRAGIRKRDK